MLLLLLLLVQSLGTKPYETIDNGSCHSLLLVGVSFYEGRDGAVQSTEMDFIVYSNNFEVEVKHQVVGYAPKQNIPRLRFRIMEWAFVLRILFHALNTIAKDFVTLRRAMLLLLLLLVQSLSLILSTTDACLH